MKELFRYRQMVMHPCIVLYIYAVLRGTMGKVLISPELSLLYKVEFPIIYKIIVLSGILNGSSILFSSIGSNSVCQIASN